LSSRLGRQKKGLKIYGWVILDNHFHAIVAAPDLAAVLRDLKSFTARQLVQQIKSEQREWLLNRRTTAPEVRSLALVARDQFSFIRRSKASQTRAFPTPSQSKIAAQLQPIIVSDV
jgi:REP element-mobilizing transposase RayT